MAITSQGNNVISTDDIAFIHCNSCYKPYEKAHTFYLLSCSDIMCRNCFKKGGRVPFCTICKKNVSFKIINDELEPKYLKLFKPETNYDYYVEEFQYKHALHLAKKIAKTEKISEENKHDRKKLIDYNEKYKMLRAERKQKQVHLKRMLHSMNQQSRITTPVQRGRISEFGSYTNSSTTQPRTIASQCSSLLSIPSIINKSTSSSLTLNESAKQFFQNRGSTSVRFGSKGPYRKKFDLSSTTQFNTHFKPPAKSTPIV